MTVPQRIILNTVATYGRSVFGMFLGLFSSRWVLGALGERDFGLFALVGSVIVFIAFLNNVMSCSLSRHYAFAIGQSEQGDREASNGEAVKVWFNAALSIHLFLPALLILLGYPIGVWCIRHYFLIDPARVNACLWVFRISLLSAYINMASIPFIAMYTARQLILELSIVSIFSSIFTFVCAYALFYVASDRLIVYAFYMMLISGGIPLAQCIRARSFFPECRLDFRYWFDKKCLHQIVSFGGWQLFGGIGTLLRGQGTAILLNRYFGVNANATYGISNTLSAQTQTFSSALIGAFMPALTTLAGTGNVAKTTSMAFRMCKFGSLLVLLFAVPLLLEINEILHLWLKTPPSATSELCSLMIVVLMIDKLTAGHMLAISAFGRIALYQAVLGTSLILTYVVKREIGRASCFTTSVGYAFVAVTAFCALGRLFFCKRQLGMSPFYWLRNVFLPLCLVFLLAFVVGSLVRTLYPPSFIRICLVTGSTLPLILGASWHLLLDKLERNFIRAHASAMCSKIIKNGRST